MAALRVALRAPLEGPLADLTRARPGLRAEATPLGDSLLLRCQGDGGDLRAAARALGAEGEPVPGAPARTFLVHGLDLLAPLLARADAVGARLVPPVVAQAGAAHVALVAFDGLDAARLRAAWPGAALLGKRTLRDGDADAARLGSRLFLPGMTRRQGEALVVALETGYYDNPRRLTTEEVARRIGVARSTFEEHLRAAEGQVVRALAPVARLRAGGAAPAGATEEAFDLFARFSEELGLYVVLALRGERVARVRLAREPPAAPHGDAHPHLARVLAHLATGKDDLRDLPVDLPLPPFEREVLEALRGIGPGEVVTYGDLARRLGRPGAARAVGNACARNPVPIVVPCHRVVPTSGGLGNYSAEGGVATKQRLLEREGAWPPPTPRSGSLNGALDGSGSAGQAGPRKPRGRGKLGRQR